MKFLIDECLSPKLAQLARDRGHELSTHVTWLGLAGMQDWTLAAYAVDGDWTLVTTNSVDFRGPADAPGEGGEYQHVPLHAGLICLNGDDMTRATQLDLFGAALDDIAASGDVVNVCLEVSLDDEQGVVVERYDLPVAVAL